MIFNTGLLDLLVILLTYERRNCKKFFFFFFFLLHFLRVSTFRSFNYMNNSLPSNWRRNGMKLHKNEETHFSCEPLFRDKSMLEIPTSIFAITRDARSCVRNYYCVRWRNVNAKIFLG